MNILVVDDEEVMVESLRIGLAGEGYCVVKAFSVRQALEELERENPKIDLVLVDYLMPMEDGFALLDAIRAKYSDLPVIVMTGYAEPGLAREALLRRCSGFLEKPFTLERLVAEIEKIRVFQKLRLP